MSKHKPIPVVTRRKLYDKYNHRCGYCGCELEYKDMQIDHIESIYKNSDIHDLMTDDELYSESNLMPSCRQCNFYKGTFSIEDFRRRLETTMMDNLKKNFNYKLAIKHGLITEDIKQVRFYFEEIDKEGPYNEQETKKDI